MKRFLFIAIIMVSGFTALAKAPNLNLDKLFEDPYKSNKSVTIQISKSQGKYFRGFSVRANAELVKKVEQLFKQDNKKASEAQDIIEAGEKKFSSMKIVNNNQNIQIGLSYEGTDGCYLFISGPASAFE